MSKEQALLKSYNLNGLELPNRVVMAPMTRSRADNPENAPIEGLHDVYYTQRASAGLIITEGSQVSKEAVGYVNTAGIYSKEQMQGWKMVNKKVHEANGRMFIQLWEMNVCLLNMGFIVVAFMAWPDRWGVIVIIIRRTLLSQIGGVLNVVGGFPFCSMHSPNAS